MRVFISYSRQDADEANAVSHWLKARSVDVFIDYQEILGTDHFPERLAHEIDRCDVLLLLLSENSMASRWVLREVEYADEQQKSIVIVRLDGAALPKALFYLARREHIDGREIVRTKALPPVLGDKLARTLGLEVALARGSGDGAAQPPTKEDIVEIRSDTRSSKPSAPQPAGRSRLMLGLALGLLLVSVLAAALLLRQDEPANTLEMPTATGAAATTAPSATSTSAPSTPSSAATDAPPATLSGNQSTSLDPTLALASQQLALLNSQAQYTGWQPQWEPYNGIDMAKVPTGCFMMGGAPQLDLPNDGLTFPVCLEAFWIDLYEVSNEQFDTNGGRAVNPSVDASPDHPRTNVSWVEASAFCALRGARLPTEAEWEYAARGPFGFAYPWGDEFTSDFVNDDGDGLVAVYQYGEAISWVGAYHMAGNAAEWTSSRMAGYPYDPADGREDPPAAEGDLRVVRGGAFATFTTPENLHAATRLSSLSGSGGGLDMVGFRCARDA